MFPDPLNPTGMHAVPLLVTPVMAAQFLEKMPNNRPINKNRVASYADARRAGEWVLNPQGIIFDEDGNLANGQHRLHMVIETGLDTPFWVTYNAPRAATLHYDEQLPRSIRDAIKMAGQGNYSTGIVSMARVICSYPGSEKTGSLTRKDAILKRLRTWSYELDFSQSCFHNARRVTRAARALVARACACGIDQDRLRDWCSVLIDGQPVSANATEDAAAITYRNYLLRCTGSDGTAEMEKYRKGQSMLKYFLARQDAKKVYGTDKDEFPVPKEKSESPVKSGE